MHESDPTAPDASAVMFCASKVRHSSIDPMMVCGLGQRGLSQQHYHRPRHAMHHFPQSHCGDLKTQETRQRGCAAD